MKLKKFLETLWWCFFVWREKYPSWEKVSQLVNNVKGRKVVVTTDDIGLCFSKLPGKGNRLLASSLLKFHNEFPNVPIIAQEGVAKAARDYGIPIAEIIGPRTKDVPFDRSTLEYNSWTVARDTQKWMKKNKLWLPRLVFVLTTPDHLGRAIRIRKGVGFNGVMVPLPVSSLQQKDYLDEGSLYWSIRTDAKLGTSILYRLREILARLLSWQKGWI